MSGEKPAELVLEPIPDDYKYVWDWFIQIKNTGSVDYNQIKAFSELMQINLQPNEVAMITNFEREYQGAING